MGWPVGNLLGRPSPLCRTDNMRYSTLGRSRLEVSRLCLGTMNFGKFASLEESHAILDAAIAAGVNYVDTANTYGAEGQPNYSERIIGEWFKKGSGRREKTVLATKLFENTDPWPNHGGLSALNIRRSCEASLTRLKTDYIDVLQMHHVDRAAPWDEIWEAFEVLRSQGKIIYAGSSNFAGWHIAVAQGVARERKFLGLVSEQSVYNLAQRTLELEVLPSAIHHGVGVIAWSPLAGGLLAAPASASLAGRGAQDGFAARIEAHSEQLAQTREIAASVGLSAAQLSLAWLLSRPGLVAPVVGPRTIEQLTSALGAIDVDLDESVLAELDAVWPGPGGSAPEAYAW